MLTILTVFLCFMVICGTVKSGEISPTEYRPLDPIGPIQELTLRLDGITKYVHELSGLRDRDANQVTKLKKQLENNQARDERVINQLTMKIAQLTRRMEELERNCNNKGQYLQDGSNSRTHVLHTDTSDTVPLGDRNKDNIETAVMEHADNRSQQFVQVQGHFADIYPQRLTHITLGVKAEFRELSPTDSQISNPPGVIQELRSRLDGLVKQVHKLTRLRKNDALDITNLRIQLKNNQALHDISEKRIVKKLTTRVAELERLRFKDIQMTSELTNRIENLELKCNGRRHDLTGISNPIPYVAHANSSDQSSLTDDIVDGRKEEDEKSKSGRDQERIRKTNLPLIHTRVNPPESAVAFHVILTQHLNGLAHDQTLKYDKMITAVGGAHYSTHTGAFTCTQAGIYMFSWSLSVKAHTYMNADLIRNDAIYGTAHAGENLYISDSMSSAILHLDVGDEVWVRVAGHSSDAIVYGGMFLGFRLG